MLPWRSLLSLCMHALRVSSQRTMLPLYSPSSVRSVVVLYCYCTTSCLYQYRLYFCLEFCCDCDLVGITVNTVPRIRSSDTGVRTQSQGFAIVYVSLSSWRCFFFLIFARRRSPHWSTRYLADGCRLTLPSLATSLSRATKKLENQNGSRLLLCHVAACIKLRVKVKA